MKQVKNISHTFINVNAGIQFNNKQKALLNTMGNLSKNTNISAEHSINHLQRFIIYYLLEIYYLLFITL